MKATDVSGLGRCFFGDINLLSVLGFGVDGSNSIFGSWRSEIVVFGSITVVFGFKSKIYNISTTIFVSEIVVFGTIEVFFGELCLVLGGEADSRIFFGDAKGFSILALDVVGLSFKFCIFIGLFGFRTIVSGPFSFFYSCKELTEEYCS